MGGLDMLTSTNTAETREHVWTTLCRTHDVRLRERDHGILLLRDGTRCPGIAQRLYHDGETSRAWVRAFNEAGLHGLERAPIPGRPAWLTGEQRAQGKEVVRRCPREAG
jgi:transposase